MIGSCVHVIDLTRVGRSVQSCVVHFREGSILASSCCPFFPMPVHYVVLQPNPNQPQPVTSSSFDADANERGPSFRNLFDRQGNESIDPGQRSKAIEAPATTANK